MAKTSRSPFNVMRMARRLTHADITFYTLPLIMLNLVAGTLAQAYIGLYEAHKMFFGTFITWLGPLPLPGGYTLIGIFTLSLFLKFILKSSWRRRNAGIILAHLGALVLLLGGLLTALTAREGFMVIGEGTQTPYVYDYHKREFFIFRNDQLAQRFDFNTLKPGSLVLEDMPFRIEIMQRCRNCTVIKREDAAAAGDKTLQTMARFMALEPATAAKNDEDNLSGLTFSLWMSDTDAAEANGLYIAFEAMPEPIVIQSGGAEYKLIFGKQQRLLPFSIRLEDFRKTAYPGTLMAQAYESDVTIIDGPVIWPARIEMNKPLRYKGYTFYQSAFEQTVDGETTILSVVENRGQAFPYLGALIITAGILLHIFMNRAGKKSAAKAAV